MAGDLGDEHGERGVSTPEALLQLLADHRQGTERRRVRSRPLGRRGLKIALLLAIVVAIALVALSVLIWGNFTHLGSAGAASGQTPSASAKTGARAAASKSVGAATAVRKARKTAARHTAAEPWHLGLSAWGHPTKRRLPDIYFRWMKSRFSCAWYASDGCWKAKVVTRRVCPHGLTVVVEQMQNGEPVGTVVGSSRPLAAETPAVLEVDANHANDGGRVESMLCN